MAFTSLHSSTSCDIESWGCAGGGGAVTTLRCWGGHWDGGLDKHMVGTTNVVSFAHRDAPAAPQTMALFLQPDTLLQTYLCVCMCVFVCVAHTLCENTTGEREGVLCLTL